MQNLLLLRSSRAVVTTSPELWELRMSDKKDTLFTQNTEEVNFLVSETSLRKTMMAKKFFRQKFSGFHSRTFIEKTMAVSSIG